jgi:hypothetical protein
MVSLAGCFIKPIYEHQRLLDPIAHLAEKINLPIQHGWIRDAPATAGGGADRLYRCDQAFPDLPPWGSQSFHLGTDMELQSRWSAESHNVWLSTGNLE